MRQKFKRVYLPKIKLYLILVIIVIIGLIAFRFYQITNQLMSETGLTPNSIYNLFFSNGESLKSESGRTNIIFMGIGGGNHDGADLTDTMILMSLDTVNKTLALISIPRDIWSDTLKDKVNSAYHYGEAKKKGGGITFTKVILEDMLGIPIHYGLVLDFSEFKKLIDTAGGIDLDVKIGFTDKDYPIEGKENDLCGGDPDLRCRYQEVTFITGLQHMNGDRALIYVRSRHADGVEGSDFARSRRQQEVIIALKNKLTQPSQFLNFKQDYLLYKAYDDATDTDMNTGELLTFAKIAGQVKPDRIKKIAFDNMLTSPPEYLYDNRFVLVPKTTFADIAKYIQSEIESK